MSHRPDVKAGDVLSFRVPETISSEDLNHLKQIAKRPTTGRTGAINDFFFSKVAEDRLQQSRYISIHLPDLSEEQITLLNSQVFRNAMTIYAYQILQSKSGDLEATTLVNDRDEKEIEKNEDGTARLTIHDQPKQEMTVDSVSGPDPRALDLIRKLQG
jgi:hypothetical protein